MIGRPKLVLASGSPRRVTLINQAGIEPDALRPANVDETPRRGELPRACANRLARAKAEVALDLVRADEELQGAYILAADVEYWPTADPTAIEGSREQRMNAYREVRDQLLKRIRERFSPRRRGNE